MSRESRPDFNAAEGQTDDRGTGSLVAFMLERSADDGGRTEAIIAAGGTRVSDCAQVSIDQVLAGEGLSAFVDSLLPRQPSILGDRPSPTLGTETIVVSPPDLELYRESPDGTGSGDEEGSVDVAGSGDEEESVDVAGDGEEEESVDVAGDGDEGGSVDVAGDGDSVEDHGESAVLFTTGILPPLVGLAPVAEDSGSEGTTSGNGLAADGIESLTGTNQDRSELIAAVPDLEEVDGDRGDEGLGSPHYEPLVDLEVDTEDDPLAEPGRPLGKTWRSRSESDSDWRRTTGRFGPNLVEDVPLVSAGRVDTEAGGNGLLLNARGRIDRTQVSGLPESRRKGHTQDHLAVWIVPVVAATVAAVVAVILWGSGF